MTLRFAIIGDVHGCWTQADTDYFNAGGYDALLFVGDLPPLVNAIPVATRLAALRIPALLIPGNHDAAGAMQFLAELRHHAWLADLLGAGQAARERRLRAALGPVTLAGFSLHRFDLDGERLGLIAARPYAMGGDRFYFRAFMRRRYQVGDFAASAERLCALVDQAPERILFLAHNGPAGLGAEPTAPWGCDFQPQGGDFGDPDLRQAIAYARERGRKVLAVVAGHMHHRLKKSRQDRQWLLEREGIAYVNAACVPRIRKLGGRRKHHHVALTISGDRAVATECWIDV